MLNIPHHSLSLQLSAGEMPDIALICKRKHNDVINKWPDKALLCHWLRWLKSVLQFLNYLCSGYVFRSVYGCSRPSLNAGSLIQFCQVPILLRPLFIPLKSLVRDDTQQVRYNGKSTELVSQLARIALLQQSISDMWRCTFCNISILLVLLHVFV